MNTTILTVGGRIVAAMMTFAGFSGAAEIHVAPTGTDTNAGTALEPMRTIQRAADLARPGDTITVHAGTYRERVNPPRGGESDAKRITYRAAPGEKVEIKGSEPIKGWVKALHDTWKATLPNRFFGTFNPYDDDHLIKGGWFEDKVPNATYENPDGSPLRVATDYHGKRRDESNPTPGPFESPGGGALLIKVR